MSSMAYTFLARLRSRWRRRMIARAALASAAVLLATAATLVLVDQIVSLSMPMRSTLRFLPIGAALIPFIAVLRRALPGPSLQRIALLAEEHDPRLAGLLSTSLGLQGDGIVAQAFRARMERVLGSASADALAIATVRPAAIRFAATSAAALVLGFASSGSGEEVWRRWAGLSPGPSAAALAAGHVDVIERARAQTEFQDLRLRVVPPAYTGLAPHEQELAEPVAAIAGSVLELSGTMPYGATKVIASVIVADDVASDVGPSTVRSEDVRWVVRLPLRAAYRALDLRAVSTHSDGEDDVVARRIMPFTMTTDREPRIDLDEPAQDLVLASATGTVDLRASATDDFGVETLALAWILSRGGGESFTFTEGEWPLTELRRTRHGMSGMHRLDLARLDLQAGDVLHVRALARDGNDVTGPGVGVSRTRLIRIARDDEMADITSLIGFPLEAEKEPVLSQRMIILMTERLIQRARTLDREMALRESEGVAREQARLREHVADVIYSTKSGDAGAHADDQAPRQPAVTAADSARHREELLEAASRATGRGTLEELSHQHDPDPAFAVNRELLSAFNAMYDAERALRLGELRAALPHEYRALEVLQSVREADRVFLRGRQSVAPVDVSAARGTGKLDGAEPAGRSAAEVAPSTATLTGEVAALAEQLPRMEPHPASLALSALAAKLLADAAADPRAGALLTRAADAARRGQAEHARSLTLQARSVLAPAAPVFTQPPLTAGPNATAAAYLRLLPRTTPPAGRNAQRSSDADPFVFATVRYESGDWDSGQLVPANLIHSLALYTDIAVAPEGVVVDLGSTEIFRYPLLYLTGHLPVRFSTAESANLQAYVERGGLVFIDDHNHDIDGAFHRTVTAELVRIFGEAALRELPNDHELYRSFFLFEDGPPTTSHELNGWGDGLIHEHLLAIQSNGRIGLLYSNKDYSSEWSYHVQNKRFQAVDNTRFGVNLIVYALTR